MTKKITLLFLILLLSVQGTVISAKDRKSESEKEIPAVVWEDPGEISARDLYYGPGSPSLAPREPFTFKTEIKRGLSPKFDIKDANNVKWRVKLGPEAQPETAATRLTWAVGYYAEEAYYFDRATIKNLPTLSRGREYVEGKDVVRGAKFKPHRKDIAREEHWDWDKNPFLGTRELSGLKVMTVLLNNTDVDAENTRVLVTHDDQLKPQKAYYVITDLGATFGRVAGWGSGRSINKLDDFMASDFIYRVDVKDGYVIFNYDVRPKRLGMFALFHPVYYLAQAKRSRLLSRIPLEHVCWIGSLVSQLTDKQLGDAFRAAGYEDTQTRAFVFALRQRINQLEAISAAQSGWGRDAANKGRAAPVSRQPLPE